MQVKFWGTRGSLPVAINGPRLRDRMRKVLRTASGHTFRDDAEIDRFMDDELDFPTGQTYGGNTSCVQILAGSEDYLVCDVGTGVREFAQRAIRDNGGPVVPRTFHFLMSHMHWDHIMGFPFFVPAYVPGNRIVFYGCHEELEMAMRRQHAAPSFPVEFDQLGAEIEFVTLEAEKPYQIAGVTVRARLQDHSGESYGFRIEKDGRSVVYSTDCEHRLEDTAQTQRFVDFFSEADLVIFDAMYSLADAVTVKADWGHSSNIVGVDLCHQARVKHYCMFHHEPMHDDETIYKIFIETLRYEQLMREDHALRVSTAFDGMEIDI
jgi:phosphoribosyl 1,2-cyclic phosphodiesterase